MRTPRPSKKRRAHSKEPKFKHRPISDIEKLDLGTEPGQCELSNSLINSVLSFDLASPAKSRQGRALKPTNMAQNLSNKTGKTSNTPSSSHSQQPFASIFNTLSRDVSTASSQGKHHEPSSGRNDSGVMSPKKSKHSSRKHEKRKGHRHKIPAMITPPTSSPDPASQDSTSAARPRLPPIGQWDEARPQLRRGDIQPLSRLKPLSGHLSRYPDVSPSEKVHVFRTCLLLKKQYLNQPLSESYTEHAFWTEVYRLLDSDTHTLLQAKFPMVQTLKQNVSFWCEERRNLLARGALFPVGAARQELEVLIDEWNEVWAKRYSKIYKAAFVIEAWPTVQDHVESLVQTTLYDLVDRALEGLKTPNPTRSKKGDDSDETYDKKVEHLRQSVKGQGLGRVQIRESEGNMSLVLDLQPSLGEAIAKYMQKTISGASELRGGDPTLTHTHVTSGDVNTAVMPSIESHTFATSSRVSRWQQDYYQQDKTLEVMEKTRGRDLPCDSVSSPLGKKRKGRHDDDDDELDRDGASPKQRKVGERADSVDSTTSTWSFPSVEELDIRRILDSPEKARARKPTCKPSKISLPIRTERRDEPAAGQSTGPTRGEQVGSTDNAQGSFLPVGTNGLTTARSSISSLETWDFGPGGRAGHSRAGRAGEYGSSSAGQGEYQPINSHYRRLNKANDCNGNGYGSHTDASTSQWFRESTPEFRAMPLSDRLDMLHRAIKERGFPPLE